MVFAPYNTMTTCRTLRDGYNVTTSMFIWQSADHQQWPLAKYRTLIGRVYWCRHSYSAALLSELNAAASRLSAKSIYFTSLQVTWFPSQTVQLGQYRGYHYWLQLNGTEQLISPLVLCDYTKNGTRTISEAPS